MATTSTLGVFQTPFILHNTIELQYKYPRKCSVNVELIQILFLPSQLTTYETQELWLLMLQTRWALGNKQTTKQNTSGPVDL